MDRRGWKRCTEGAMKRKTSKSHFVDRYSRAFNIISYMYIGLPILIFMIGWVRWIVSIAASLIIMYSFYTASKKNSPQYICPKRNNRTTIIVAFVIICGWVFLSGIGGFVYQNGDHYCRNEIFRILVEYEWPVQKDMMVGNQLQTRMLSYYMAFWLPSAIVGKGFGLSVGFAFQVVWAVLGICLIYLKISARFTRYGVIPLLIFIFFSGLDIIGFPLLGKEDFIFGSNQHIEFWGGFQFSSHTTQLFWVFNQAVYGWILTLMLLEQEDNRHSVLIWSCGLLECTFPFVGMLPYLCYTIFRNFRKKEEDDSVRKAVKELFSVENVIGAGLIGIISFLYLLNNGSAGNGGSGVQITVRGIGRYIVFMSIEAFVYYLAIYKLHKKNPLFYISLLTLMICPFVRVGESIDFCMRVSIPSLVVLCLLVSDSLFETWKTSKRHFAVLLAIFLLGCVTPIHEICRTIENTPGIGNNIQYISEVSIFSGGNFSSNNADSLFCQYLMK